jgi:hypothetical protein
MFHSDLFLCFVELISQNRILKQYNTTTRETSSTSATLTANHEVIEDEDRSKNEEDDDDDEITFVRQSEGEIRYGENRVEYDDTDSLHHDDRSYEGTHEGGRSNYFSTPIRRLFYLDCTFPL